MEGWVKLYRCLMHKPIWNCSTKEQKVILITLLMMANHKGNEWEWQGEKYRCESGQFITSLDNIQKLCGKDITIQNVRTALKKFEKYEFLTNISTKTGRLITIVNWDVYQGSFDEANNEDNKVLTKHQQSTNKELTPNKNDKNDKNDKNNIKKKKDTELDVIIDGYTKDLKLRETLREFLKMRKTIKKPMTSRALNLLLNKLDKLASDNNAAIEILNQSILNCWQSIFELKGGGRYGHNTSSTRESKKWDYTIPECSLTEEERRRAEEELL